MENTLGTTISSTSTIAPRPAKPLGTDDPRIVRGSVWFADLGPRFQVNTTYVQSGTRPVLVISNDLNNRYGTVLTVMTDAAIENLRRLIANKEVLIKKALGLDSLPIEADDNVISFPWYDKMPSSEVVKAASTLVSKLVSMAKNQKRVNAKADEPVENMKYSFRCLLLRLGFVGPEYKDVRSTLLKNFSGSGAFKSGARRTGPRPAVPLDQPIDVQASESEDASNA